jgi:hypothetical protein
MSDFTDLETELKRLQPRAASPDLAMRVEAALAQEVTATPTAGMLPRRAKPRVNWFTFVLGATAAVAAVVAFAIVNVDRAPRAQQTVAASATAPLSRNTPAQAPLTQPAASFVPDGLTRVVYHRRDEGLVYSRKSEAPVRRVRSRARETLQWKEPDTGASLRVSYPTEEVELIPVSGQ